MDSVNVVLTILCAYNLAMMVTSAFGDKFPQPGFRNRHANWVQSWKNTQNPMQRYWIGVGITFAIMVLFNFTGSMLPGFLVFLRLLTYILGYRRVKAQIAQVTVAPPFSTTTDSTRVARAEVVPPNLPAEVPVPQATAPQPPAFPEAKRLMSKGVMALLVVVAICVAAGGAGYLYNRAHPLDNYVGSAPDNSPADSGNTSTLSGVLNDPNNKTGSSATGEPAWQAAPAQQPVQAPSQRAMQQAVQQDTATKARNVGASVTANTYGNVVASFYPGKSPLDAIDDALILIHSELTVMDMAPSGYPEYQIECEPSGQCVGGTGAPMGSAADVAKEMFPVNPADVGQGGVTCGQYICNDGKGNVIGRNPSAQ